MFSLKAFNFNTILKPLTLPGVKESIAGLKYFPPPPKFDHVEFADRPKLRIMEKVPQYPGNLKPPKMQKRLRLMRGPEKLHNTLLHKQFGIISQGGGRLAYPHYEMIRLGISRKIDVSRMFSIWRVPAPWQPVTKKGQGQRMGHGKGAIDRYVTPIKSGRVIVEIGGNCEFEEVKGILTGVCNKLPFKAMVVSQELLDEMKLAEEKAEANNVNYFTKKYVIQNNLGGCHNWLAPVDHKWFGKHL